MATRGRPPGCTKTGGRVKGKSIDKGERQLVTSRMAGDIMAVYESLGGIEWLLKFAQANPKEFIQQGLSRMFPAPQRGDDPDVQVNTQVNIGNMSDFEAAQRVAFALAKATYEQEQLPPTIEAVRVTSSRPAPEPEFSPRMWRPPTDAPDMPDPDLQPEPVEALDPARQRWVDELPLTPEQRADNALVRETVECSLETYAGGSSAEQFDAPRRPSSRKLSPGERCRALVRRGRDLL